MIIIRSKINKNKTEALLILLDKLKGDKIIFNCEFGVKDFVEIVKFYEEKLERKIDLTDCDYRYLWDRNNFTELNLFKFLYLPHKYKYVVLYFNEIIESIDFYKGLESKINATIVIVVQEDYDSINEEVIIEEV